MDNITIARGDRENASPQRKGKTTMKKIKMNACEANHIDNTIVCGKTFMKNASKYGTAEYNDFVGMKRDFPTYKVVVVEPRKAEARMSTKGLTREFMELHIRKVYGEGSEQHDEFKNMLKMSEGYQNPYMYMRRWFVKANPNWDGKEEKRQELRAKKATAKIERAEEAVDNQTEATA